MIWHSILPFDLVFRDQNSEKDYNFIETKYRGEKVVVSPLENNQYVICRLISTLPKSFLDPNLQPGTVINGPIHKV